MLSILDRHHDWALLVGLVGGGQEINTGEAGLREWGRAIAGKFPHWSVHVSPQLLSGDDSTAGQTLFEMVPPSVTIETKSALHLQVALRSYRAEKLTQWVEAVLENRPEEARAVLKRSLGEYPIVITRSLKEARAWLNTMRRGSRRSGLIASSGARRLRPYGIDVQTKIDVAKCGVY